MSLFNFGKKKEEESKPACCCKTPVSEEQKNCCCTDSSPQAAKSNKGIQSIKVLGAGCKSCHTMYENTKAALKSMGIEAEVEYITDMEKIMSYGIMSMPGLVINEKTISAGRVLKPSDIEKLLQSLI